MAKDKRTVSVIGGADGPTSVFVVKKNSKLTLRQKVESIKNKIKRTYVEKTLKPQSHNLDEVIEYIVNEYGFIELDKNSDEIKEEYNQMRVSFIMQYAPELLGESLYINCWLRVLSDSFWKYQLLIRVVI